MQEFSVITLDNGIRCVHRRVKSQVANIALTINAGTRDELPRQHGVAHLVEHLLFKGTGKRSAFQVNSRLESVGGELNAFTTKEETVVHATCLRSDYSKGVDLLRDMVFNSSFAQREIEKEVEVIVDEINSYKDSPSELIFDDFEDMLFEGSTLGRNILGTARQLRKIERDDLLKYVSENYNTDHIIFSSSSSLTHSQFKQRCEKFFSDIPSNLRSTKRQSPEVTPRFEVTKNKHTHQTHTIIGGRSYSLYDNKRLAFSLLINILGGNSSLSRLNQTLREKHALTYGVEASYSPYCDSGVWQVYFGCESDKQAQSFELAMREIERMKTEKLTGIQLHKAKKQLIGQLALSSDNSENFILNIAKSLLVFGDFDTNNQVAAKINSITAEQIQEAANEVFTADNSNLLIYR